MLSHADSGIKHLVDYVYSARVAGWALNKNYAHSFGLAAIIFSAQLNSPSRLICCMYIV